MRTELNCVESDLKFLNQAKEFSDGGRIEGAAANLRTELSWCLVLLIRDMVQASATPEWLARCTSFLLCTRMHDPASLSDRGTELDRTLGQEKEF